MEELAAKKQKKKEEAEAIEKKKAEKLANARSEVAKRNAEQLKIKK